MTKMLINMKKVFLLTLILLFTVTTGCSEEGSEALAPLYATSFAEDAIGYDMEFDRGDLRVFEIDTPPAENRYYKVNGTIKREADGKHYRIQAQVEYIREDDIWRGRYLKIDGQLIQDRR